MFLDLMPKGKSNLKELILSLALMMFLPETVSALAFSDAYWQFETINMQIPSACSVTKNGILNEKGHPIVEIDVSDYDEQALYDAFGYENEEQCVQRYLMYTFLNEKGEGRKIDNSASYPLYVYECVALSEEKNTKEIPVVLALLVDKDADKIYAIFLENEYANIDSAAAFLRNITINHDRKEPGILDR